MKGGPLLLLLHVRETYCQPPWRRPPMTRMPPMRKRCWRRNCCYRRRGCSQEARATVPGVESTGSLEPSWPRGGKQCRDAASLGRNTQRPAPPAMASDFKLRPRRRHRKGTLHAVERLLSGFARVNDDCGMGQRRPYDRKRNGVLRRRTVTAEVQRRHVRPRGSGWKSQTVRQFPRRLSCWQLAERRPRCREHRVQIVEREG